MGKFIDFAAVRAAHPILDVLTKIIGAQLQEEAPNKHRGTCPFCEEARSFVCTTDGGNHKQGMAGCFKCQVRGDSIALVAKKLNLKANDAAAHILTVMEANVPTSTVSTEAKYSSQESSQPKSGFDRAKYQAGLDRSHESLKDIPADFLERADIGVSSKGALKGIVMPLYDHKTGEFICYAQVSGLQLPKATVVKLAKTA